MSGVCGVVSLVGARVDAALAATMAAAAQHRGTAGAAAWSAPEGTLVQQWRRAPAAAPAGALPAGDVVVVADARLDNEPELRRALRRTGHLRSPADEGDLQETIEAAYAAWGEGFAARLLGDFAAVVWDRRRRTVLAARDPLAMRSLFYRREPDGRLLVATEAKQLLAVPGVPGAVDEGAVLADLMGDFGRADRSFFVGVDQLAPGSLLVCGPERQSVRTFWSIDLERRSHIRSADEAAEEVRRVFLQAVVARLDPVSPTGVLLSGGVDSGSVASAAGWLRERDPGLTPGVHAFSWAFDRLTQCDERHVSRHVVERYGFRTTDVPADDAGPLACYPAHGPDVDDPFLGGFQPLIEHALASARDSGIQVVLGGDRGDLVIGDTGLGCLGFVRARRWADARATMAEHHEVLGRSWPGVVADDLLVPALRRLRRRSPAEWARWARDRSSGRQNPASGVPDWVRPDLLARVDLEAAAAQGLASPGLDPGRRLRHEFVFTPMHLRGMAWSERTYARFGLGFADPFSDRRLVELVLSLPQSLINRPGDQSKPLMRSAMRGLMPEPARIQADKILPTPLFDHGLRSRAATVRALLTGSLAEQAGWVDGAALLRHFERYLAGAELDPRFWSAIEVEQWMRIRSR